MNHLMSPTRTVSAVLLLIALGCNDAPELPSEADARAAFALRAEGLSALETALRSEVEATGLDEPRATCAPPDDDACLTALRARDSAVEAARDRLRGRLGAMHPVCAEVTVVSGATGFDPLRAAVNTCDPGTRGDRVEPASGVTIDGFQVGRGVYFLSDADPHPGISVERGFTLGDANATMRLFFYTDGAVP